MGIQLLAILFLYTASLSDPPNGGIKARGAASYFNYMLCFDVDPKIEAFLKALSEHSMSGFACWGLLNISETCVHPTPEAATIFLRLCRRS